MHRASLLFPDFLFAVVGCFFTVFLVTTGVNAVHASAVVTLALALAAIVVREEHAAAAACCGTLAGMTSTAFLESWGNVIILSLLTGALYGAVIFFSKKYPKHFMDGYGGRLGTIALVATLVFLFVSGRSFWASSTYADPFALNPWGIIVMTMIGGITAWALNKRNHTDDRPHMKVIVTGLVGLGGALIFNSIPMYGASLAGAGYAGAFAAMTSGKMLRSTNALLLAVGITGLIFYFLRTALFGLGGVLGFSAFLGVIMAKLILP